MEDQSKDIFGYSYQIFKTKKFLRADVYQNKKLIKTEYRETASLCLTFALEFENTIVKGNYNA